jgi:hypothetical protein
MIVRIQGEGQYELDDEAVHRLDEMDAKLFTALEASDEQAFHHALTEVVAFVESHGKPVPNDRVVPSTIILPPSDITLDEARRLFTDRSYFQPVEA